MKTILITGTGLGKTLLSKLLAATYSANNIPCKIVHYPNEADQLSRSKKGDGFLIVDCTNGYENERPIATLKPWQTITISGAYPPASPLESLSLRLSSGCEPGNSLHTCCRNHSPQIEEMTFRVAGLPCTHDRATLHKMGTRLSRLVRSYSRSGRDKFVSHHP